MKMIRPRLTELGPLSYGDNQRDAGVMLYVRASKYSRLALPRWRVRGDEKYPSPSWTNVKDWEAGRRTVVQIAATLEKNRLPVPCIAVVVKHGAPLGAALGATATEALKGALDGHPFASMGGALFANFPIDLAEADIIRTHRWYKGKLRPMALIAAPEISEEAHQYMRRKTRGCFSFENKHFATLGLDSMAKEERYGCVHGAMLIEKHDPFVLSLSDSRMEIRHPVEMKLVMQRLEGLARDWILAAAVASTSPGNVVSFAANGRIYANGISHQDRIGACRAASDQYQAAAPGIGTWLFPEHGIAAANSFFPSVDGVAYLQQKGINVVYATSGSENDERVKDFCLEHDMILLRMPDAVARGFTH